LSKSIIWDCPLPGFSCFLDPNLPVNILLNPVSSYRISIMTVTPDQSPQCFQYGVTPGRQWYCRFIPCISPPVSVLLQRCFPQHTSTMRRVRTLQTRSDQVLLCKGLGESRPSRHTWTPHTPTPSQYGPSTPVYVLIDIYRCWWTILWYCVFLTHSQEFFEYRNMNSPTLIVACLY
jgi:hypothetical protein